MHAFSESSLADTGVVVLDMAIEDISITNAELAKSMAAGAVARTGLVKARLEAEVTRAQAQAEQSAEVIRAEGRAQALAISTEADARRTAVMAEAEAARISRIDAALAGVSPLMAQRELVAAAGGMLKDAKASLVFARSPADVSAMLGAGGGGAGMAALQGLLDGSVGGPTAPSRR